LTIFFGFNRSLSEFSNNFSKIIFSRQMNEKIILYLRRRFHIEFTRFGLFVFHRAEPLGG